MKVRVTFFDEKTGEVYEEVERVLLIGKRPFIDRGFVKIFVAFLTDVLEDKNLGNGAWRLLLYIVKNMDYNSLRIHLIPEEVARDLGVTERTIYRWLRALLEGGYIEKLAVNVYRLKPYSAVKGHMNLAIKTEPDF